LGVRQPEIIKMLKAIMKLNRIDRRSHGRPKTRWKDNVEADLRALKVTNWNTSIEDKLAWRRRLLSKLKPTLGCKAD
jgi:hypothetical protein